mmetsp:Transcript_68237/g.118725  ORF Transcript_68237/g.118725 Transcript_68237/m.118725 type:complete len:115 (-) Transcript_68237:408-752(-)
MMSDFRFPPEGGCDGEKQFNAQRGQEAAYQTHSSTNVQNMEQAGSEIIIPESPEKHNHCSKTKSNHTDLQTDAGDKNDETTPFTTCYCKCKALCKNTLQNGGEDKLIKKLPWMP